MICQLVSFLSPHFASVPAGSVASRSLSLGFLMFECDVREAWGSALMGWLPVGEERAAARDTRLLINTALYVSCVSEGAQA
jgi:hypothetical protein